MFALYPLKFEPQFLPKIWGGNKLNDYLKKTCDAPNIGESWEISGVLDHISVVSNGFLKGNNLQELIEIYMGDLVGDPVYDRFGIEFPLLIKFIDASDDLSIQVHPPNDVARKRHNAYGKTEMWYILQADPGARLISGFNRDIRKDEYLAALENKELVSLLNFETVKAGDVFFIPAGRVHAIGKGILLAEIQQTSDITYRIYDWDRPGQDGKMRELHTDLALDVIDFKKADRYKTDYQALPNQASMLVDCPYFQTKLIRLNGRMEIQYNQLNSFVIFMCTRGQANIIYGGNLSESIATGQTVLIPASFEHLILDAGQETEILEVSLPL